MGAVPVTPASGAPLFPVITEALPPVPPAILSTEDGISAIPAIVQPTPPVIANPVIPRSSLAALVAQHASTAPGDSEANCLATAVYFESKGEPLHGQLAVAEVVMNRAKSGRFAKSLCGVVRQPSQFSFVRGGAFPAIAHNAMWRQAVGIAHVAMNGLWEGPAADALYFHAKRVSPNWSKRRVAAVGNHIFYR